MNAKETDNLITEILDTVFVYDEESLEEGVIESRLRGLLGKYDISIKRYKFTTGVRYHYNQFEVLFLKGFSEEDLINSYKLMIDAQLAKFNIESKSICLNMVRIEGLFGNIDITWYPAGDSEQGYLWLRAKLHKENIPFDSEVCKTEELFNLAIRNWLDAINPLLTNS